MIETKVIAATAGGGFGAALSSFLIWWSGVTIWGVSGTAADAGKAAAAVPQPVSVLLGMLVAGTCALVAGYVVPHTHRPDLITELTAEVVGMKPVEGPLLKIEGQP